MEIKNFSKKAMQWIKKYKLIALLIMIGLALMMIPTTSNQDKQAHVKIEATTPQTLSLEDKLSEILQQIDGAGKVEVILTVLTGEEVIYQTNDILTKDSDGTKEDTDTVTVTDSDRNQNGLVRQVNPPVYLGAIILCQGADDPIVKLAITEAVAKVTGLRTNCISVLKMK